LAGENRQNIADTRRLWDTLSTLERDLLSKGDHLAVGTSATLGGPISGPIVLDPGSLAFDFPEKYGYKLLYHNLEEYIQGLSSPSWHQWINYETSLLNKEALIDLILENTEFTIAQREEYGFYDKSLAEAQLHRLNADIIALNEVNRILKIEDIAERESALTVLKKKYEAFLNPPLWAANLNI